MGAEHERDPRVHFLNDPTAVSGSRDRDVTNARDSSRVQGGNNYHLKYTRLFGDLLVEGSYSRHNGEVSDFAAVPGSRNSIVFRDTDVRTLADEQLGGFGLDDLDQRDTDGYKATAVVQTGRHALHGGFELMRNSNFRDTVFDGGLYTSLAGSLAGLSAAELFAGSFSDTRFDPTNSSDHSGFVRTVDQLPDRAAFYSRYDLDGDGVISQEELASGLTFASTAGNPHGAINYDRMFQSALGAQQTRSNGTSLFLQDTFSATDRLSFNLGLRTERFAHFATDGANIFTFDWTLAPRLSVSYDPAGNGRQRISAFYGKYYDPIRNNLTNFAGTLTGSIREEQVYANDQWVTYRTRGGPQQADALFAPTTKTPWTDDFQVSWESDLGGGRSVMALYTKRRTRDIIEDYDMALYTFRTDGTTNYPGPGRRSAGLDSAPVQGQHVVPLGPGIPDRRQLALELRHARQPHVPGLQPEPAGPRRDRRGVRVRGLPVPLALADLGGDAPQPLLRDRRRPSALQLPARRLPRGAVRRRLQPARQPGRHPQPGPAGRRGRQRVRRRHPLHAAAAGVHRRPAELRLAATLRRGESATPAPHRCGRLRPKSSLPRRGSLSSPRAVRTPPSCD